jgi:hypothetical protein
MAILPSVLPVLKVNGVAAAGMAGKRVSSRLGMKILAFGKDIEVSSPNLGAHRPVVERVPASFARKFHTILSFKKYQ